MVCLYFNLRDCHYKNRFSGFVAICDYRHYERSEGFKSFFFSLVDYSCCRTHNDKNSRFVII